VAAMTSHVGAVHSLAHLLLYLVLSAVNVVRSHVRSALRAVTVERILRQKIARGVRDRLVERFDRNGDGKVSGKEFLEKVVANPMATLYRSLPDSNPIA
jgi:hypothetical protein